ncbi:MAG: hypothetical protein GTO02_17095 [Candidatus Dadabacteria bacterium]|nr:hypothetical protein [Candidatus Dadabacteria bacterium]NIQ16043.1 hypothetical protein [Candidatus Dadabacteria bacterium]
MQYLSFSELDNIKSSVTAILFSKSNFNIEAIIRWLIDRKLLFENYTESENFYIVEQPQKIKFKYYEYRVIDKNSIYAEIGTDIPNTNNFDEIISSNL